MQPNPSQLHTVHPDGDDASDDGVLGRLVAIVDQDWSLRVASPSGLVLGSVTEVGESILSLVHPRDLPKLLELGECVRSAQVAVARTALEARDAEGEWTTIGVELTCVAGDDPAPWLAIHEAPLPVDAAPPPTEEWDSLLALRYPELSSRERKVAEALLSGYRVTTIARHLFLSPSTVRNHLSSMFHKVGVESQAELIERFHALRNDPFPGGSTER